MKFSIIIPVYNEAENISNAITALLAQNVARSYFEIIVVDNNSTDNSAELAKKAGADLVIKEMRQGTNMARQAGLARAKGEIIAFLDADCVPPPDWLEKIERDLKNINVAAVSGPFDYGFTGLNKILTFLYYKLITKNAPTLLKLFFLKKSGVIIGGNFAARRTVINKIGGLPQLDFWGDDAAIAMLISRRVGPVIFDHQLIVKSSPRRFKKNGFFKIIFKYYRAYFKIFFDKNYS